MLALDPIGEAQLEPARHPDRERADDHAIHRAMTQRVVDGKDRAGVANLAVDRGAGAAGGERVLPRVGEPRSCAPFALGPREVFLRGGRRHDEIELAWPRGSPPGDMVEQFGAADGLVGDDQVGRHRSPFQVDIGLALAKPYANPPGVAEGQRQPLRRIRWRNGVPLRARLLSIPEEGAADGVDGHDQGMVRGNKDQVKTGIDQGADAIKDKAPTSTTARLTKGRSRQRRRRQDRLTPHRRVH